MSRQEYQLQPFALSSTKLALKFSYNFNGAVLEFKFSLLGADRDRLKWPKIAEKKERKDGLWQTTAFELFIGEAGTSHYIEVNLAPTGDWNVYEFSSERQGMKPSVGQLKTPFVSASSAGGGYEISGVLDLQALQMKSGIEISATSVLDFSDGHKEYWSLKHCSDKPDFHKRESFVIKL